MGKRLVIPSDTTRYTLKDCRTFWSRLKGYMFDQEPMVQAVLLNHCSSIHTFGMRFALDVFFLDESNRVLQEIRDVLPGKLLFSIKGTKHVLETPSGMLPSLKPDMQVRIEDET